MLATASPRCPLRNDNFAVRAPLSPRHGVGQPRGTAQLCLMDNIPAWGRRPAAPAARRHNNNTAASLRLLCQQVASQAMNPGTPDRRRPPGERLCVRVAGYPPWSASSGYIVDMSPSRYRSQRSAHIGAHDRDLDGSKTTRAVGRECCQSLERRPALELGKTDGDSPNGTNQPRLQRSKVLKLTP